MKISLRKILAVGLFLGAASFFSLVIPQPKASAYTAVSGTGYFSGNSVSADADDVASDVIGPRPAIPAYVYDGSNDKADFINWLGALLPPFSGCSPSSLTRNQVGAAFIVNSMLGKSFSSRTKCVTLTMWNDLKTRINDSNIGIGVQNYTAAELNALDGGRTTFYSTNYNGDNFSASWLYTLSRDVVYFYQKSSGTRLYYLEVPCANPLLNISPGLPVVNRDAPNISVAVSCPNRVITGNATDNDFGPLTVSLAYSTSGSGGPWTSLGTHTADPSYSYTIPSASSIGKYQATTIRAAVGDRESDGTSGSRPTAIAYAVFGPCVATLDSGVSITPSPAEETEPLTGRFWVTNTNGTGSATGTVDYTRYVWQDTDRDSSWDAGETQYLNNSGTVSVPVGTTVYLSNWSGSAVGKRICVGMRIVAADSETRVITTAWRVSCAEIGRKSFVQAFGGDVVAGAYEMNGSKTCTTVSTAGISGWNKYGDSGSTSNAGAGTQMATFALNKVYYFGSTLGNTTHTNPRWLTLANSAASESSGYYGGTFGQVPANCDFVGNITGADTTTTTIGSTTLASAAKKTIYITGQNVYINGNVTYSTSWGSLTDIPSFRLIVVGGNIYIDNNVSQLDGLYVAEPNGSGVGGNIYTCSSAMGSPISTSSSTYDDDCNHQLKIYGSFVAKHIDFGRTSGTLRLSNTSDTAATSKAAETFVFTPEMWLPNSASTGAVKYSFIHGLPPTL